MTPFKRPGSGAWYGRIPHPEGLDGLTRVLSHDKKVAKDKERMLRDLKERGYTDVLWAIIRKDKRTPLSKVYDQWAKDPTLKALRASLDDVDLSPLVDEYERVVLIPKFGEGTDSRHSTTRARKQLRKLIPVGKPFPRSKWTTETVEVFLAGLSCKEATKVVYLSNLRQFDIWLLSRKTITQRVTQDLAAKPKAGRPRRRFLSRTNALKLADAQSEPFRTMEVLATIGAEFSALWAMKAGDIDRREQAVNVRGTKTETRERWTPVPDWAWGYIEPHIKGKHPEAPLFRVGVKGVPEPTAKQLREALYRAMNKSHRSACKRLGIADYRSHDGRHTHTVRWLAVGASPEDVGKTLGHTDGRMVQRVYGQGYTPDLTELRKLSRMADIRDEEDTNEHTGQG